MEPPGALARSTLDTLPEDVLYGILDQLDTARDAAHLARSCRSLHAFMEHRGWRAFARHRFPGVFASHPQLAGVYALGDMADQGPTASITGSWRDLADTLTWQSRAWDRRALSFQCMMPREQHIPVHKRPRPFRPSMAAHFKAVWLANGKKAGIGVDGQEMLVWGAGEDIVARYRLRGRGPRGLDGLEEGPKDGTENGLDAPPIWKVLNGKEAGFRPGYDDVCAVAVVENRWGRHDGRRGILAARENGHLALLSGETDDAFGRVLARFRPIKGDGGDGGDGDYGGGSGGSGVDQSRIYSVKMSTGRKTINRFGSSDNTAGIAAVTTPSHVLFYPVPRSVNLEGASSPVYVAPATVFSMTDIGPYINLCSEAEAATTATPGYDLPSRAKPTASRVSYNACWTAAEGILAVGLGAGADPLRYLVVQPSGVVAELTTAYRRPDLEDRYRLDPATRLVPNTLEPLVPPVGNGGSACLMLSGWRDGTIRLQDLRTPSPWDIVYQDQVMGSADVAQSLLFLAGTHRFVVGAQSSAMLRTFDLRWPRNYYYTDALQPCTATRLPLPQPPRPTHSQMGTVNSLFTHPELPRVARCNPLASSMRCRWHAASRDMLYRSTCSFFMESTLSRFAGRSGVGSVWSLCNSGGLDDDVFAASDASELMPPNFYAGLNNSIVEVILSEYDLFSRDGGRNVVVQEALQEPPTPEQVNAVYHPCHKYAGYRSPARRDDPHFSYGPGASTGYAFGSDDNDTGVYQALDVNVSIMETGAGEARPDAERNPMWLPSMRPRVRESLDHAKATATRSTLGESGMRLNRVPLEWKQQHRLDYSFQSYQDYNAWTIAGEDE